MRRWPCEGDRVLADFGTVGGGLSNTASGGSATVGGGFLNASSGQFATVPGGEENSARGYASFAAGHDAKVIHDGTFVWNDRSITTLNDIVRLELDRTIEIERAIRPVAVGYGA